MRDDMVPGEELRRYICKCSDLEEKVAFLEAAAKMKWNVECYGACKIVEDYDQISYGKACCIADMMRLMEDWTDDDLFYIKRTDDGRIGVGLKVYVKGGD